MGMLFTYQRNKISGGCYALIRGHSKQKEELTFSLLENINMIFQENAMCVPLDKSLVVSGQDEELNPHVWVQSE